MGVLDNAFCSLCGLGCVLDTLLGFTLVGERRGGDGERRKRNSNVLRRS